MKKFVIAVFAAFALLASSPAMARNAAGGYNWTGFYAGLNLGAAVNDSSENVGLNIPTNTITGPETPFLQQYLTDSADLGSSAFTGGAQIGYNYQIDCLVLGLETDFNYNGVDDSHYLNRQTSVPMIVDGPVGQPLRIGLDFVDNVTQKFDYFGTLRGRVGYTPANRFLVYATGGLAYGHVSSSSDVLISESLPVAMHPAAGVPRTGELRPLAYDFSGSSSDLQVGWTVGGGVEYALNGRWSVRAEYLYVDLGSQTYTYGSAFIPEFNYTTEVDTAEHVMRVGVNYRF